MREIWVVKRFNDGDWTLYAVRWTEKGAKKCAGKFASFRVVRYVPAERAEEEGDK